MHEHQCKQPLTIKTIDTVFSELRNNHYLCAVHILDTVTRTINHFVKKHSRCNNVLQYEARYS